MKIVNMHVAKTHLSRLIEDASNGEPFIIARAGKPAVTVRAIEIQATRPSRRIGFLRGEIQVPDDFDTMGAADIQAIFGL